MKLVLNPVRLIYEDHIEVLKARDGLEQGDDVPVAHEIRKDEPDLSDKGLIIRDTDGPTDHVVEIELPAPVLGDVGRIESDLDARLDARDSR